MTLTLGLKSRTALTAHAVSRDGQGCQIFLGPNIPKWEKIKQITTNFTKRQ
jgi:hypothetical protein